MATITRLRVHPIKGLPPVDVTEVRILRSGRDAATGEVAPGFQRRFAGLRRAQLPAGASTALFNHYYRFSVNTRIAASEAGKAIRVGDPSCNIQAGP